MEKKSGPISAFIHTTVIGQRKAFCMQRIPESRCVRKETVDIDVSITSRNGDSKIMQPIRITSGAAKSMSK